MEFLPFYESIRVQQCLIFVHLGLYSVLVLLEQTKMGEGEVLLNSYAP